MDHAKPASIWTDSYWVIFRERVHILLAKGYEDALARIKASGNRDEPAITGFITEAIEEWLLVGPEWCDEFEVKDDPPISGQRPDGTLRQGRGRARPDIIIGSTKRPRPKFIFEAKRLRNTHSIGEYIGADGMGCFVDGIYASKYHEGGILGYFEVETAEQWQIILKDSIATNSELLSPQLDVQILSAFPLEWISQHNRPSVGRNFSIFHILLDCKQESKLR